MTITEFLLARIAEDEAEMAAARRSFGTRTILRDHSRFAAECEAKRRIVDEVTTTNPQLCSVAQHRIPTTPMARAILGHLAAAYADHPDFDEAWRP